MQQTAARVEIVRWTVQRTVCTDRRQRAKEGGEKVSYYKGCVKKKGNKNTARARSALLIQSPVALPGDSPT